MKLLSLSILLSLTVLPCNADENTCLKTFYEVDAMQELTPANTFVTAKALNSTNLNEVKTVDFARHPQAIHKLDIGTTIQLTDFYYPDDLYPPRIRIHYVDGPAKAAPTSFPPDLLIPSLGDFEKSSQKNVYNPKIQHGMQDFEQEGFTPGSSNTLNPLNELLKQNGKSPSR